jgi:hypothetical protein
MWGWLDGPFLAPNFELCSTRDCPMPGRLGLSSLGFRVVLDWRPAATFGNLH